MSTSLRAIWLMILCCGTLLSLAQTPATRIITGTVYDEGGISLPGVGVAVKGTTTAVSTNVDGKYSIAVPASASTLVFSYIGMTVQEIPLSANSSTLNVTLKSAATSLENVVVIGYGTAKRSEVTSAISSISEKDIKDLAVSGVDQALQGKLAGVSVATNGGQPGGGVSVRVRGITSVNGNEPLYVIDGVPLASSRATISHDQLGGMGGQTTQSALASLNPSDILSIDVLKDASAQAIYGSQAANGVVIVTTKRGKAGEGKITYEGYYGLQEVPKKLDIMNLSQFAQYNNEVLAEIAAVNNTTFTPIGEFANPALLGTGTDWQDEVFQRGIMQNHQMSFSGGHDKTTYYTSMNYFDQEGTILGSEFNRLSLRFNIDQQVKSWFKLGLSSNLTRSNQRVSLTNGSDAIVTIATSNSPASPVYDPSGGYATTVGMGGYNFGNVRNPIALALAREVKNVQTKGYGNLYGEVSFTKNLSFRSELNFDYTVGYNSAFQPFIDNILTPSKIIEQRSTNAFYGIRNLVNYNQAFGKHKVTALLGHEFQESDYNQMDASRQDLTLNMPTLHAGVEENQSLDSYLDDTAMESYLARANYTYDDRYSLSLSGRRDGSSSFGEGKRIGYFPAASIGWTVTNEAFAENMTFIDYLKIRAGAGAVGNQNSPTSKAYETRVRLVSTAPFGQGGIPLNVGNRNLAWESVITYNGGIDMAFLNKKLEVTVDVYKKETSDMILTSSMPVYTGLGIEYNDIKPSVVNAGNMVNKGIDIGITSYNMATTNFDWRTTVVFSKYKNILNSLNSETAALLRYVEYGNAVLLTRTVPGRSVGGFYGFLSDGLFTSMEQLNSSADQGLAISPNGTWLGDVKFKDINNDGKIDNEDMTYIGDPNPDFTFGMTNTFRYKNFDLSVFLQGSYGNDVLNYTKRTTEKLNNVYNNQLNTVTDRYTEANPGGSLPRYNQWHNNNFRVSDRFVEDGTYLRIQNVTLSYNLPARWINTVKLTNARLFVTGQNLHTFTKYTGYDPELGAFNSGATFFNIDNGNYPNPRTFTFGANLTF